MHFKNYQFWLVSLLVVFTFIGSIALIYVKHSNRLLFMALDNLYKKKDELYYQRTQLILEYETLSALNRVDMIAQNRLDMGRPSKVQVIH